MKTRENGTVNPPVSTAGLARAALFLVKEYAVPSAAVARYAVVFPEPLRMRLRGHSKNALEEADRRLGWIRDSPSLSPASGTYHIIRASTCRLMVEVDHSARELRVVEVRGPADP